MPPHSSALRDLTNATPASTRKRPRAEAGGGGQGQKRQRAVTQDGLRNGSLLHYFQKPAEQRPQGSPAAAAPSSSPASAVPQQPAAAVSPQPPPAVAAPTQPAPASPAAVPPQTPPQCTSPGDEIVHPVSALRRGAAMISAPPPPLSRAAPAAPAPAAAGQAGAAPASGLIAMMRARKQLPGASAALPAAGPSAAVRRQEEAASAAAACAAAAAAAARITGAAKMLVCSAAAAAAHAAGAAWAIGAAAAAEPRLLDPSEALPLWQLKGRCGVLRLRALRQPPGDAVPAAAPGIQGELRCRVVPCALTTAAGGDSAAAPSVLVAFADGWAFQDGGAAELAEGVPLNLVAHRLSPVSRGAEANIPTAPVARMGGGDWNGRSVLLVCDRAAGGVACAAVSHPGRSVRATAVADAAVCLRRAWLGNRVRDTGVPNLACLSGSAVHEAVQQLSQQRQQGGAAGVLAAEGLLGEAVRSSAVAFAAAGCAGDDDARALVMPFAPAVAAASGVLQGQPAACAGGRRRSLRVAGLQGMEHRLGASDSAHGVHGVADVLAHGTVRDIEDTGPGGTSGPVAVELKTLQHLRRHEAVMKPQHRAQLFMYLLLLAEETGHDSGAVSGVLAYLVRGQPAPQLFALRASDGWMEVSQLLRLRNSLAAHEAQDLEPPAPSYGGGCRFCSQAAACAALGNSRGPPPPPWLQELAAEGYAPPRPREQRPPQQQREPGKQQAQPVALGDSASRSYFRRWHRWLAMEAAAEGPRTSTVSTHAGGETGGATASALTARLRAAALRLCMDPAADRLRLLVAGDSVPRPVGAATAPSGWEPPAHFNAEQRDALRRAAESELTLIQGLPGTGKTATIAALARLILARGQRVLIAAGTHSAVDSVCLQLLRSEVPFSRVHLSSERAAWGKGNVHPAVQEHIWQAEPRGSVSGAQQSMQAPRVVCATAQSMHHPFFAGCGRFDHLVLDEAGQLLQPVSLAPMFMCSQWTLVGDHEQLPPVVKSREAREEGAARSLLAALAEARPDAVARLTRQYRMNSEIATLPNAAVYDGRLQCGSAATAERRLAVCTGDRPGQPLWLQRACSAEPPVVFVDTSALAPGVDAEEERNRNSQEVELALAVLNRLDAAAQEPLSALAVSPFVPQVAALRSAISPLKFRNLSVECMSVDQSQGRDVDLVLVSLAKRQGDHLGSHLRDARRLNVAFTRARAKLVVFGAYEGVFRHIPEWQRVMDTADKHGWVVPADSVPPAAP
eukprot:TRINITY_DN18219_c0_g1_i1.p1 TRINITY_DN18219_c0_g1~~TRINITY_DN18219_c0_g1_i1.p1  ORF type:complete len:1244 (+),score=308.81 TRINITY_DN18219_c0_g1_i1:92-3823(+)